MIRSGLFLVSVLAGLYSVVAWFGGLCGDAVTATVVALLAAGGVCLVDYLEEEFAARDVVGRAEATVYRESVWQRREAGL